MGRGEAEVKWTWRSGKRKFRRNKKLFHPGRLKGCSTAHPPQCTVAGRLCSGGTRTESSLGGTLYPHTSYGKDTEVLRKCIQLYYQPGLVKLIQYLHEVTNSISA